jgi:hypothetical protein
MYLEAAGCVQDLALSQDFTSSGHEPGELTVSAPFSFLPS